MRNYVFILFLLPQVLLASSAQAALVTYSFTSTVTEVYGGNFNNPTLLPGHQLLGTVGTGTFTFDNSLVSPTGTTSLLGNQSMGQFQLAFTIFGQTLNEMDDLSYFDNAPELIFSNGSLVSIDYFVGERAEFDNAPIPNPVAIDHPDVSAFGMGPASGSGLLTEVSPGAYTTAGLQVFVSTVPLPAGVWLFVSGLLSLVNIARQKHKV